MKAKNKVKMFAIIGLIALVAVGSTLAYLSSVTDTKENKFTSSKDVNGTITETEWDKEHGDNGWSDYLPGESTAKNPQISIDGDSVEAYVAMKVTCLGANDNQIAFSEFMDKYAKVTYKGTEGVNTTDWEKDDSNDFYFYRTTLQGGVENKEQTNALFDSITVNAGIKTVYKVESEASIKNVKVYKVNPDGSKGDLVSDVTTVGPYVEVGQDEEVYIVDGQGTEVKASDNPTLPKFTINVTGYAIQAEGTGSTYKAELRKLAGL